ncbi:hypothetical protein GCM10008955_31210 [Deinococcus malanensis]|uniref:Uncharacterized protein n=1 Tax=Deinococcus malanensis TaxID=1706855 RepID=A0ABQ2F0J8_9DEIO|nr:hypothetical protein GCM10008955_31210 [Deinococcus malanensis]
MLPIGRTRRIRPLRKLAVRYPAVAKEASRPRAPRGTSKELRIEGHETPSRPSGSPRLKKARKASSTRTGRREREEKDEVIPEESGGKGTKV